ncbi:MAG: hypothetical protein PHI66_01295 [Candidatus Pacebacteria bacterium]|nr:hypothetical protein [Candidatus Paceibacterota bacterium]
MKIVFRVAYAHEEDFDSKVMQYILNSGLNLFGFPEKWPPTLSSYPRDLVTCFSGVVFLNSKLGKVGSREKGGIKIRSSPYGEGGRVLCVTNKMIVAENIIVSNGKSSPPVLNGIEQLGIKVGLFPMPLVGMLSFQGDDCGKMSTNDHLDRVACLILGKDDKPHLLIEKNILSGEFIGEKKKKDLLIVDPERSLAKIKEMCGDLDITLHCLDDISVPYALNMIQFFDGKILMTGGDDIVYKMVSSIVGEEKVFRTETPIKYFPLLAKAGIRCLIGVIPEILTKET